MTEPTTPLTPWHATTTPSIVDATTTLDNLIEKVKTVEELNAEDTALTSQVTDLTAQVKDLTDSLTVSRQRTERAQSRVNEYSADATRLNELMNEKADEEGWCSKYEDSLEEWNTQLTHIELTGRVKEYDVTIDVTLRYTHHITVEASSEDAARDEVNNMSDSDFLDNLDYDDMYSTDVEIEDVEAQ